MKITKVIKYFITEINYERELSTLNEKEKKSCLETKKTLHVKVNILLIFHELDRKQELQK